MSPRCTRKTMAHRVGTGSHSSPLRTSLRTRFDYRSCSEADKASLRWRKKHPARLSMILAVLLVLGVIAVLLMGATALPGVSPAVNPTREEASLFSKTSNSELQTSNSELPKTGGP